MFQTIILDLPAPNSTNHHWTHSRYGVHLSKAGKAYRRDVAWLVKSKRVKVPKGVRLAVGVQYFPPDNLRRDLDNFCGKSLLDALVYSKVIEDDSLIDELVATRMPVFPGGKCKVFISQFVPMEESNADPAA